MDTPSKIKRDADTYTMRLYDFIPVNAQLIDHVRRLDGFNVSKVVVDYGDIIISSRYVGTQRVCGRGNGGFGWTGGHGSRLADWWPKCDHNFYG